MRLYDYVGVSPWLLVGISGLALTCSQACANGKTHETGTEVTASGGTGQAGAQSSGGTSQGGTGNIGGSNVGATGGNAQGDNTGGVSDGGNPSTGGQPTDTGGTGDGGVPATGGQGVTDSTGGENNVTGGTNSTGGMPATGGTPGIACMTALNCVSAPNNQTTCDSSTGTCVQCVTRRIALPVLVPITTVLQRNALVSIPVRPPPTALMAEPVTRSKVAASSARVIRTVRRDRSAYRRLAERVALPTMRARRRACFAMRLWEFA